MNAALKRIELTVFKRNEAERLYWCICDELRVAKRCGVVVGMDTPYEVIRSEAIDSWLHDYSRRQRFLFTADHNTTLEDVEWQLSR